MMIPRNILAQRMLTPGMGQMPMRPQMFNSFAQRFPGKVMGQMRPMRPLQHGPIAQNAMRRMTL